MVGVKCVVFLMVVNFLWSLGGGDTEVSCIFMESCVLQCSFQAGDEIVIHWLKGTKVNTEENVHSYYSNTDQLTHQDQHFRGRTSLFRDQISRGNTSLQLAKVEVQDEGRYKCYTSTIRGYEESFINLRVDAPVRKVNFQKVENRITCSSDGIYPETKITWSTNPPSSLTLQSTTEVQRTEQQLYNISSSLMLSDNITDLDYICTISTRTNSRRASLIRQTSMNGASSETTIPCTSSNISLTSLIWRFNYNQTILTQIRPDILYNASEEWIQQVKDVSKTGSLTLKSLSSKHDGTYTCELSNAKETYITNTFLRIIEDSSTSLIGTILGVVVLILCVVGVGVGVYCRNRRIPQDGQMHQADSNSQNRQQPDSVSAVSHPHEEIPLRENEGE